MANYSRTSIEYPLSGLKVGIGRNNYNSSKEGKISNVFAPQPKNLASIIRGYKSAVTSYAKKNNLPFAWQPRYYEHILRDMNAYNRISDYIRNNPAKWQQDKFFGP